MNTTHMPDSIDEISAFLQTQISDLQYLSSSFVKRRIQHVCNILHISSQKDLLEKLESNILFLDTIVHHLSVPITEMFRDSSVWQSLSHDILPKLLQKETCNIWMPGISSGEELYSLSILLKQIPYSCKLKIFASDTSISSIEIVKKGVYANKSEKQNMINYAKLGLYVPLNTFYIKSLHSYYMNASLLQNVQFIYSNSIFEHIPREIDLIMFRNQFLYYAKQHHHTLYNLLHASLRDGGYLVLGTQEGGDNKDYEDVFKLVNTRERIFKKR